MSLFAQSENHIDPNFSQELSRAILLTLLALLALSTFAGSARAQAETYTVLHSFGQGADGANPFGGVSAATVGKSIDGFWGATENGGTYGYGTIFRLTSSGGVWTEVVAHSFSGADGASPSAAPVGAATAAYGTTPYGGNGFPGGGRVTGPPMKSHSPTGYIS
jgi:uncharacterized repeat protein (TIGR03803 family)